MPICITCSTPVKNLYTTYSKADDRSLGKGVRLTQCPNCKRFADKYVEHDYIVLFIDLVLIKPQVYRHLLFNRLGRTDDKLDPSILRLGILLILFDVYITWARIEQSNSSIHHNTSATTSPVSSINSNSNSISNAPIITQYLFFLTLNVVATIAQHLTIRTLARLIPTQNSSKPLNPSTTTTPNSTNIQPNTTSPNLTPKNDETLSHPPTTSPSSPSLIPPSSTETRTSSSSISTAILVSSCTKLFPILLVIWPTSSSSTSTVPSASTPAPSSAFVPRSSSVSASASVSTSGFTTLATSYISWIVLANNIEALYILLDCGYVIATILAMAGVGVRWVVEGWVLNAAGLGVGMGIGGEAGRGISRFLGGG